MPQRGTMRNNYFAVFLGLAIRVRIGMVEELVGLDQSRRVGGDAG